MFLFTASRGWLYVGAFHGDLYREIVKHEGLNREEGVGVRF